MNNSCFLNLTNTWLHFCLQIHKIKSTFVDGILSCMKSKVSLKRASYGNSWTTWSFTTLVCSLIWIAFYSLLFLLGEERQESTFICMLLDKNPPRPYKRFSGLNLENSRMAISMKALVRDGLLKLLLLFTATAGLIWDKNYLCLTVSPHASQLSLAISHFWLSVCFYSTLQVCRVVF